MHKKSYIGKKKAPAGASFSQGELFCRKKSPCGSLLGHGRLLRGPWAHMGPYGPMAHMGPKCIKTHENAYKCINMYINAYTNAYKGIKMHTNA